MALQTYSPIRDTYHDFISRGEGEKQTYLQAYREEPERQVALHTKVDEYAPTHPHKRQYPQKTWKERVHVGPDPGSVRQDEG